MTTDALAEAPLESATTLIDAFSALTGRALAAIEEGALDEVDEALRQRAEIIHHLDGFLAILLAGDPGEEPSSSWGLEEVRSRLATAGALDSRLRLALGTQLHSIGVELNRMGEEEAVKSAYGQAYRRDGRHIDLVR